MRHTLTLQIGKDEAAFLYENRDEFSDDNIRSIHSVYHDLTELYIKEMIQAMSDDTKVVFYKIIEKVAFKYRMDEHTDGEFINLILALEEALDI